MTDRIWMFFKRRRRWIIGFFVAVSLGGLAIFLASLPRDSERIEPLKRQHQFLPGNSSMKM